MAQDASTKTCGCGCGAQVSRSYAPGHDARHASQLRQAVEAGSMTTRQAKAIAAKVSPAFVAKVERSLARIKPQANAA
jgi:hypothetical protein